ncbi:MAG: Predicted ATPase [Candidatus Kentron sp. G]|nr:MAG: Predicted ATPase [Candidatus Kentron sp. G]VFN02637.1 MAG: Predicted ATPase [Candidatus Kentron sp. G]VFN04207.1 MAG: Predicted ATPase [Candidatus Kentron sp. G]
MLDALQIHGFKCFDGIVIDLRKINLFSGPNSSGKSSAIQAFLLLCNNAAGKASSPLNGMWLHLGAFDECRNHRTNARKFRVGVQRGEEIFQAKFRPASDDGNEVDVTFMNESAEIQRLLGLEHQHVYYLPANRIGPEDLYPKNFDRVNFLGDRAEFIVDFLYKNRKRAVVPLLIADSASITLEHQVNHWLGELFGIRNTIRDLGLTNSLSVELSRGDDKPVRPYHMGSGVSFALGVLVSCLGAKPDDIVIIENPEIHLHPKAQSDLTRFLCFAANGGIQIILETHSDHVFNGLRKAIVEKEIANTDVAVQFF